ncbi:MAG: 4Fe-4S dicluster domain-containing protein [Phycisphaeraceae bacterium]|nr:MAG: 4Fe-4S dicluster domain-containing protein [Phycisphaeraceae bacterium]
MRESLGEPRRVSLPVLDGPAIGQPTTDRRGFVKLTGAAMVALATGSASAGHERVDLSDERMGVLVDLTECVGCRRCEFACAEANQNPHGKLEDYDDQSVFEHRRRPTPESLSVVNRFEDPADGKTPVFTKIQCMHCEHAPCVSACLVGAMEKQADGSVTYDASKCIGCRYCMMACPFERLAYEFDNALTPRVRKCQLCQHRTKVGQMPACVEICPVEALTYGKRDELVKYAHELIAANPERYVDHVYGETEGGGTSWLYVADRPFAELGFPDLKTRSRAETTEAIQHGIFQGFIAPIALASVLTGFNFLTKRGHKA